MQGRIAEIRERGAQVVALGQGEAATAAEFCRGLGVEFPCLGDPRREGYAAFGLRRGSVWGVIFAPFLADPMLSFRRLRGADLKASATAETDVLQLPGVAVVDRGGRILFLHRSERTDDLPPVDEILQVLGRVA